MEVILIGAGRYGNGLVGAKYLKGNYYGANLSSVVDPNIDVIKKSDDYNLSQAKTFDSFEKVPITNKKNTVAELAVEPKHIYNIFNKIVKSGVKKVIFPKPVTSNFDEFEKMVKTARKNNMQTAVTSNWFYSDITQLTRAVLEKIKGKKPDKDVQQNFAQELNTLNTKCKVEKVEIEYSKKHERLIIDPPSQELPHALQIISSIGLCDLDKAKVVMDSDKQSKSAVNLKLEGIKEIEDGIYINSDLQQGDKTDKTRERTVKIYLDDDDDDADIITDYDVQFVGNVCTKKGSVSVDIQKDGKEVKWKKEIQEDNMDAMYKRIFGYFGEKKGFVLTLKKYEPVARKISQIQENWEKCLAAKAN